MTEENKSHSCHSAIVRALVLKRIEVGSNFNSNITLWHRLISPFAGHRIEVDFATFEDREDVVWIRTGNWRAEDEPCGYVSKEDARKIYKTLLQHGFVKEE